MIWEERSRVSVVQFPSRHAEKCNRLPPKAGVNPSLTVSFPISRAPRAGPLACSNPDVRYLLDERAAIHEFDGRLDRDEAELRAAEEVEKQLKETTP